MALTLLVGFLLGYLGSVPAAGPLAVLVMATALEGRSRRLLALAIGGAVAEGAWALAAASGLSWVLDAHPSVAQALYVGGAVLAIVVGLAIAFSSPPKSIDEPHAAATDSLTGFFLVALNPSFLATWLASCAMLRSHPVLARTVSPSAAPLLAASAAVGVVLWYATLGALIARYRERLSAKHRGFVRALGAVLVVAGVVGLVRRLLG